MAGLIRLEFNRLPEIGDNLTVYVKYLNSAGTFTTVGLRSDFAETRTRSNQVAIGSDLGQLAMNFVSAFNADHGNTGGQGNLRARLGLKPEGSFTDIVEITLQNPGWLFDVATGGNYFDFTIFNDEIQIPNRVEFAGYDYVQSTCEEIIAIFNLSGGSGLYNTYIDGVLNTSSEASPVRIILDRNKASQYSFSFTDSTGLNIGSLAFKTPPKISSDKIGVSVAYTDQGAAVSIAVAFVSTHVTPLKYSLNGSNFSEENIFTGQLEGDYTVYVKDAFGCVTTKNFTVDGFSTETEVNFSLSDINPIRYARAEGGKKNRYNTLSFEQLKNIAHPFVQYFTDEDNPITQLKTNAKFLRVRAIGCEGGEINLAPVKRSNHLGQTFRSTATQFSTSDGQLGVYFGVVDVLDPVSGELVESKDFGYQVPYAFNKTNGFLNLQGFGLVPVDAIVYDEDYEAFILKFNISFTGAPTQITVDTIYNIQNYEIYEFMSPISQMPESFNIVIEAGNSESEIKYAFISERIERTVDSDDLAEIIYWNTRSLGGMNYGTGVAHTLRLYGTLSKIAGTQTVEGYNGDVERYNTDNAVFDGEEFIFDYLSEEMARKLTLILVHNRLFINGVLYRLGDEPPEINSRFTTNVCDVRAILRKGGDLTEGFNKEIVEAVAGEGLDKDTYDLEQAIAAARGRALILWKI